MPSYVNAHDAGDLASFSEALALHRIEKASSLDEDVSEAILNFPSRHQILAMSAIELDIFQDTLSFCWKRVTGSKLPNPNDIARSDRDFLDGCYWLIPGGIMLPGINHYASAKKNKGLLCSILNLNPLVFEQYLAGSPNEIVRYLIQNGAARTVVNRAGNSVFCQASEKSWPWVMEKMTKMYHKTKVAKILDPTKPFTGWKSGVPFLVK